MPKSRKDSEDDMDKEMKEDQMDDYDMQSATVSMPKKKQAKKKKEDCKSVSGESIDRFNGRAKDVVIDE